MSPQRFRSRPRPRGLLAFALLLTAVVVGSLIAGIAQAGDVASAEAHGALGLDAAKPETAAREADRLSAEGEAESPWADMPMYLIVASLIFVGYAHAAWRRPWLPLRRRRKP